MCTGRLSSRTFLSTYAGQLSTLVEWPGWLPMLLATLSDAGKRFVGVASLARCERGTTTQLSAPGVRRCEEPSGPVPPKPCPVETPPGVPTEPEYGDSLHTRRALAQVGRGGVGAARPAECRNASYAPSRCGTGLRTHPADGRAVIRDLGYMDKAASCERDLRGSWMSIAPEASRGLRSICSCRSCLCCACFADSRCLLIAW